MTFRVLRRSAWSAQTILGLLAVTLLPACLTSSAFGQSVSSNRSSDAYYIGYFGNANLPGFPDTQVNIVNPGSTGGYSQTDFKTPVGDLCANIYVFKADQEMVECCSCFVSPNGHIQLSTNLDLTKNPFQNPATVPVPVAGVIKIVSSDPFSDDTCSESASSGGGSATLDKAGTGYDPDGSLRTWNTHARQTVGGASPLYTVTEVPFRPASLGHFTRDDTFSSEGATELIKLQSQCYVLQNTGSGRGRCTCGTTPI